MECLQNVAKATVSSLTWVLSNALAHELGSFRFVERADWTLSPPPWWSRLRPERMLLPLSVFQSETTRAQVQCLNHSTKPSPMTAEGVTYVCLLCCGLRLGRSELLRSLRHWLRVHSQGHHTIDRLEEEEKGVERGSAQRSSFRGRQKGPSSIRPTLELFQRQHWGNP